MREFHYNSGFVSWGGWGLQDLAMSHLTAPSCISAGFLLQTEELLAALNSEIGPQPMGQTLGDQTHVPCSAVALGLFLTQPASPASGSAQKLMKMKIHQE